MKTLRGFKNAIKISIENEIATAILVFVVLLPIVYFLNRIFLIQFKDVLGNINGSLFDLILFGVIFVAFNKNREKKRKIIEYSELIEDFRDWKSDEAKYRILGAVKRLQELGVKNIDLNRCYLKAVMLNNMRFENADLNCIDLSNANISNCKFIKCNFSGAQLPLANLTDCDLIDCNIDSCNFFQTNIFRTNFGGSNLRTCSEKNNSHKMNIFYECRNVDPEFINAATKMGLKIFDLPDIEKINRFEFFKKS